MTRFTTELNVCLYFCLYRSPALVKNIHTTLGYGPALSAAFQVKSQAWSIQSLSILFIWFYLLIFSVAALIQSLTVQYSVYKFCIQLMKNDEAIKLA